MATINQIKAKGTFALMGLTIRNYLQAAATMMIISADIALTLANNLSSLIAIINVIGVSAEVGMAKLVKEITDKGLQPEDLQDREKLQSIMWEAVNRKDNTSEE